MHIFSCYRYIRYLDHQLNKMKSSSLKQFYCYSKSIFSISFTNSLNFIPRTVGYLYTVLIAFNYDKLNVMIIHQTQNACLHILKIRINIKVFRHISMFPLYGTIRPTLKCMVLCSISIVVRHGRCIQRTATRGLLRNDSVIQLTPRFKKCDVVGFFIGTSP